MNVIKVVTIGLEPLLPSSSHFLPLPLLFYFLSKKKKSTMWQVGIVLAREVRWPKPRHCSIKKSHSFLFFSFLSFFFFLTRVGIAHGPSGKYHFAFRGGPIKIEVFVEHSRGWHFLLCPASPGPSMKEDVIVLVTMKSLQWEEQEEKRSFQP